MGPLPAAGTAPTQTHRAPSQRARQLLAALCALLAFMAVLAVVPLATAEPAEAHERTRYRCAYDPFTNVRQCWSEKVAHTHRTIPDNPPPDTSPTTTTTAAPPSCPAGTTGTPPNCSPVPPDNTNRATCPAGTHSNGGAGQNCHANHDYSNIACGTGSWSPGHGHSTVPRPACPPPPKCPAGQTGTPPNCVKDTTGDGSDDDDGGDEDDSGDGNEPDCTPWPACKEPTKYTEEQKCPAGQTGTPPNCEDSSGDKGTRSNRVPSTDCPTNKHSHKHDGKVFGCHPDNPGFHADGVLDKIGEELGPIVDDVGEFVIIQGTQIYLCSKAGKFLRFVGASGICQGTLYAVTEVPSTLNEIMPPDDDSDDDDSGSDDDDSGDGTDDDSDDDTGDGHPGGTDDDDPDTTDSPGITWADVQKAIADYRAGRITPEEMRRVSNGWACQQYGGHYCRYAQ